MYAGTFNVPPGERVRLTVVSDVRNYVELLDATGVPITSAENGIETTLQTEG